MDTRSFDELITAYRGYLLQKEITRMQCYYSVAGTQGKNFNPGKIWLPGDPKKVEQESKAQILTKDEFIEEYRRSGFEVDEHVLKQLFG